MSTITNKGLALTSQQAAAVAAALHASARVGAVFTMTMPAAEGSACLVFAGTGAIDIKRFEPFHQESYRNRAEFCAAYALRAEEATAHAAALNLATARVVGDSTYTPKRFFIEDGSGRILRRAKSNRATQAPPRFWLSEEAAQSVLERLRDSALVSACGEDLPIPSGPGCFAAGESTKPFEPHR